MHTHQIIRTGLVFLALPLMAAAQATGTQSTGRVVEDVIARVHNEIITLSDLNRARQVVLQEIAQECSKENCTPARREEMVQEGEKHLLRDLIDQSLMVQRAKDSGITVETDLVRYLDQVRVENNLKDMEELERAVTAQGLVFEDWKDAVRKRLLQDQIIQREVRPNITEAEVEEYYQQHKEEFIRDERVFLAEIFCTVEGKPESEWPAIEEKCKGLRRKITDENHEFSAVAKSFSDGSTAPQGGDLGGNGFGPEDLPKELAEPVFKLKRGEMTEVIRVQAGFIILRLNHRYEKGQQPKENVTGEIQQRIWQTKLRPALREYLTDLRGRYYLLLKPGYVDTAGVEATPIIEVAARQPDEEEDVKKKRKWYWPF